MQWIHDYELYLFDFDGLLVNTEQMQFAAYKRMCAGRGVHLNWSFEEYCRIAHYSADAMPGKLYGSFPELKTIEPRWEVLYAEKKKAMEDLLNEETIGLMPGVEKMLTLLENAGVKRCVVTHSPDHLVAIARKKNPILNTIPYWFTREHYSHPKPNPECYLKAIEKYAIPSDRVIGFEDSPRGLTALMGTRAKPVLVCEDIYPEIPAFKSKGVSHFHNFNELLVSGV